MIGYLFIAMTVLGSTGSQLLMKSASRKVKFSMDIKKTFISLFNVPFIISVVIIIIIPFLYNLSLDYFSLSYAFSFMGLNYVLVLFLSKVFFGEPLRKLKVIGTLLILLGIWLQNPIFR